MSEQRFFPPSTASDIRKGGAIILRGGWAFHPDGGGSMRLVDPSGALVNRWTVVAARAFALAQLGEAEAGGVDVAGGPAAIDREILWRPIDECPRDLERPGGPKTWKLRCINHRAMRPGVIYSPEEEAQLAAPFETTGRLSLFNDSGWTETRTGREIWPIAFANHDSD